MVYQYILSLMQHEIDKGPGRIRILSVFIHAKTYVNRSRNRTDLAVVIPVNQKNIMVRAFRIEYLILVRITAYIKASSPGTILYHGNASFFFKKV